MVVYCGLFSMVFFGIKFDKGQVEEVWVIVVVVGVLVVEIDLFWLWLFDGLVVLIGEWGYCVIIVFDIVWYVCIFKCMFYDWFISKEQCFLEFLLVDNEMLGNSIWVVVDLNVDWYDQICQVVEVYVIYIEFRLVVMLSWICEFLLFGVVVYFVQCCGMEQLISLLIEFSVSFGFWWVNLLLLNVLLVVILLGGLCELIVLIVEDGQLIWNIVELVVDVLIVLFGFCSQECMYLVEYQFGLLFDDLMVYVVDQFYFEIVGLFGIVVQQVGCDYWIFGVVQLLDWDIDLSVVVFVVQLVQYFFGLKGVILL